MNSSPAGFSNRFILLILLSWGLWHAGPVWGQESSSYLPKVIPQRIAELEKAKVDFVAISPFAGVLASDDLKTSEHIRRGAIGLTPNPSELSSVQRTKPEYLEIVMPGIKGESLRLRLFRVSLGSSKTQIRSASGRIIDDYEGVFYRGVIQDNFKSLVAISIFPDHIRGFISDHSGNLILGPMSKGPHILYQEKVLPQRSMALCSVDDHTDAEPVAAQISERNQSSDLSCIGIYWEVDNNIFTSNGSMNATLNWMNGLVNEVYALYHNEGVVMTTRVMNIWDIASPYTGNTNLERLTSFQTVNGTLDGLCCMNQPAEPAA